MLLLTSVSPADWKRLKGVVLMNIPASGARINSKTNAPRKRKMRFMEVRRCKSIKIKITNYTCH
jgi:hypothetical protein